MLRDRRYMSVLRKWKGLNPTSTFLVHQIGLCRKLLGAAHISKHINLLAIEMITMKRDKSMITLFFYNV